MKLRLVSVIQNHFVNATLFGVELDVFESFSRWNYSELSESLNNITINKWNFN